MRFCSLTCQGKEAFCYWWYSATLCGRLCSDTRNWPLWLGSAGQGIQTCVSKGALKPYIPSTYRVDVVLSKISLISLCGQLLTGRSRIANPEPLERRQQSGLSWDWSRAHCYVRHGWCDSCGKGWGSIHYGRPSQSTRERLLYPKACRFKAWICFKSFPWFHGLCYPVAFCFANSRFKTSLLNSPLPHQHSPDKTLEVDDLLKAPLGPQEGLAPVDTEREKLKKAVARLQLGFIGQSVKNSTRQVIHSFFYFCSLC